jgi:hypothetical protein
MVLQIKMHEVMKHNNKKNPEKPGKLLQKQNMHYNSMYLNFQDHKHHK